MMELTRFFTFLASFWCLIDVSEQRCRRSIFQKNGVEIMFGTSLYDRVVVLYLMKRRCERRCFEQLSGLNELAKHYEKTGEPVSIIAIKPHRSPSISHFKPYFPHLNIYSEPRHTRFMRVLRDRWKEVFIYGNCGRERFYYGYPYSSLSNPYIRYAIQYVLYYPDKCEPC